MCVCVRTLHRLWWLKEDCYFSNCANTVGKGMDPSFLSVCVNISMATGFINGKITDLKEGNILISNLEPCFLEKLQYTGAQSFCY